MAYVSVGQIENLEEAISGLVCVCAESHELYHEKILNMQQLVDNVNEAYTNGSNLLNQAMQAEAEAYNRFEEAEQRYSTAQEALEAASAAFSACKASGYYDEDGEYVAPDCSCEEAELAEAEAEVEEAAHNFEAAQQSWEQAKELRMLREQQQEQFTVCVQIAQQLNETVAAQYAAAVEKISEYTARGQARLQRALQALESYLAANPEAAQFQAWLNWSPSTNSPVTPDIIHDRMNLSPEQLQLYFNYLVERNPAFREKIAGYREELKNAHGDAEKQAILLKVRRNLSGEFAEHLVEQAFKPLGARVAKQRRTDLKDGSYTKTDIVIEDLKTPVILGKGKGMAAPKGGSIAIEVKCGRAPYLYNQKDHMVYQTGGHQDADASITICSRDIKDLSPEKEQEVRDALRDAGSPIAGMLPQKEEIDEVCWNEIQNTTTEQREKKEGDTDDEN